MCESKERILEDRARLLEAINPFRSLGLSIAIADDTHMLSLSADEAGRVSYSRSSENNYDDCKRVKTTIGRFIRRTLGWGKDKITDLDLKRLGAHIDAVCWGIASSDGIALVSGDAIIEAYRDRFGCQSCMTDDDADYTRIYAINPDKVRMLKYQIGDDCIRALVWTCDCGTIAIDRRYGGTSEGLRDVMAYANSQKWVDLKNTGRTLFVTLKNTRDVWPYMDTFRRGDFSVPGDCHDSDSVTVNNFLIGEAEFASQTGGCSLSSPRLACLRCHRDISGEGDSYSAEGHTNQWCERCFCDLFSYCDRCESCIPHDETRTVNTRYGEMVWCDDCADRHAFECNSCGVSFDWELVAHSDEDDDKYCSECFENEFSRCGHCDDYTRNADLHDGCCETCTIDCVFCNKVKINPDSFSCGNCKPVFRNIRTIGPRNQLRIPIIIGG